MTDEYVPKRRLRVLDDMRIKDLQPKTQTMYLRAMRDFTRYLGHSPDTATPEELRALPPRFGKWHTVYTRMLRWVDAGVLDRLFDALQEHHMIRVSIDCLGLDSTSIKVHPDGTGAPKKTDRKRSGNLAAGGTPKST